MLDQEGEGGIKIKEVIFLQLQIAVTLLTPIHSANIPYLINLSQPVSLSAQFVSMYSKGRQWTLQQ